MSATLIARSPDLLRLREAGYSVQVVRGAGVHLLVHDVPYVDAQRRVRRGTLVAPLELNGDVAITPVPNHQAWFAGDHPCEIDGNPISGIVHSSQRQDFGDGIVVDHGFSTKRRGGQPYADNFEKFQHYANVLTAPAQELEPGATARVHRAIAAEEEDNAVFRYADTASSRSRIGAIVRKLRGQRIAIVGLGGTGSYVLDLLAKTPVAEIHLYDGDRFLQHNAFRAPGAPGIAELTAPYKVEYLAGIYGRMRKAIVPHATFISDGNVGELLGFDFVFVCIDRGDARGLISSALIASGRAFLDAGIEAREVPGEMLAGQCRTTLVTPARHDHLAERATLADVPHNDLYASNIQIAELNALNAAMAVLAWKKYVGFYGDHSGELHAVYSVSTNAIARSDGPP
jgi:hypothetical protein